MTFFPKKAYLNSLMNPELARQGEIYCARLENVLLETNYSALFDGDKIYYWEVSGRNFAHAPYVRKKGKNYNFFSVVLPSPERSLTEPFILLGTDGALNYSHWLTRNLLKLSIIEKFDLPASLPILINENLSGYQLEYLELLGVPSGRLLKVPTDITIRCREIHVPINLRGHPKMLYGIKWLRDKLKHLVERSTAGNELLYVSRRDTSRRKLLNEDELEGRLSKLGFNSVTLAGMSVKSQIDTFARARILVGCHGAGLTNIIFCRPDTEVIEIGSPSTTQMRDFSYIASIMGFKYQEIVGDYLDERPDPNLRIQAHKDYFVNIERVLQAVQSALDRAHA